MKRVRMSRFAARIRTVSMRGAVLTRLAEVAKP
jgi:hypothetical protein